VVEDVVRLYEERHPQVHHLVRGLLGHRLLDPELRSALHDVYWTKTGSDVVRIPLPWLNDTDSLTDLTALVTELGPSMLFKHYSFLGSTIPSPASSLLASSHTAPLDLGVAHRLVEQMVQFKQAWMRYDDWKRDYEPAQAVPAPGTVLGPDLELLLRLPYLEAKVDFDARPPFELDLRLRELAACRGVHPHKWGWDPATGMSEGVIDLLTMWTTRDFNVFE
jgi:hypothetical protein